MRPGFKTITRTLTLLTLLATALFGCSDSHSDLPAESSNATSNGTTSALTTIPKLIGARSDLSQLTEVLIRAGLDEPLAGPGPFTVFAPNNDAFGDLDDALVQALLGDTEALSNVLQFHVVVGRWNSANLADGQELRTLSDKTLRISISGEQVSVIGDSTTAIVGEADLEASNGIVHIIGAVLVPVEDPKLGNIPAVLTERGNFTTLLDATATAGIVDQLDGAGPLTLFAPNDTAFEALPSATLNALLADPEALSDVLFYHLLGDAVASSALSDGQMVTTLNDGSTLTITVGDSGVFINDTVQIITTDIPADNGVIHEINAVLLPPEEPLGTIPEVLEARGDFTTLLTATDAAGLTATLGEPGPFTLFAPNDAAFEALPSEMLQMLLQDPQGRLRDILLYHVVDGETLAGDLEDGQALTTNLGEQLTVTLVNSVAFINGVQISVTNVPADNGIIHVIDAVLLPPEEGLGTVLEILDERGNFTTLLDAIDTADIELALSGPGPFTLVAPNDDAFASLPEGLLDTLDTEQLADILTYHLIQGQTLAVDLEDGQFITTALGQDIRISINDDGEVFINDTAQIIITDILASNGIIHVIDAVLIPGTRLDTIPEVLEEEGNFTTLLAALNATEVGETLAGEGPFTVFAPTDDAFERLLTALGIDAAALLARDDLSNILMHHIVASLILAADIEDGQMVTSMLGETLTFTITEEGVFINGTVQITTTDILASNGVVHAIDTVLIPTSDPLGSIPEVLEAEGNFTTLLTALEVANLLEALAGEDPNFSENVTLFAPTDAAFEALPEGALEALLADPSNGLSSILAYHVVDSILNGDALQDDGRSIVTLQGENLTITFGDAGLFLNDAAGNTVEVTQTDIEASNGVIHVIDAVLMLPPPQELGTIPEVLEQQGNFSTLLTAINTANLGGTLNEPGPFTVFAPTDDAFDNLPEGVLDALLSVPDLLFDVLLYHINSGELLAEDLENGQTITTDLGQDIQISINGDGEVFINNVAQIIIANIPASNGIIHAIDTVLAPAVETFKIPEELERQGNFTTLLTAIDAAGLTGALSDEGPFTVFAPTDDAFDALPDGALAALLAEPEGALQQILLYHVVSGEVLASTLSNGQVITTRQGATFTINIGPDGVFSTDAANNMAQITTTDIEASNGVIHVIDAVLMLPAPPLGTIPEVLEQQGDFATLLTAIDAAGLTGTLSSEQPFTVFAPTDDAFDALPDGALTALLAEPEGALQQILLYHAVSGAVLANGLSDGQVVVSAQGAAFTINIDNGAVSITDGAGNMVQVTTTDIIASNGVIHVIDAVLMLPAPPLGTIPEVLEQQGDFATLLTAVEAAGLADTLSGDGPFTVFAPTDDAFDALPDGALTALLAEPEGALQQILLYHVVSGAVASDTLSNGQVVETVQGATFTINIDNDAVSITDGAGNTAQITVTDLEASNGVIHAIDAVLMLPAPPLGKIPEVLEQQGNFVTLLTAIEAAGLTDTLSGEQPLTVFAPTDDAFDALPDGALTALLAEPEGTLKQILLYHVVPGAVLADALSDGQVVLSAQGASFTVNIDNDAVSITDDTGNTVQVTTTDLEASNGVIHVIDAVLMLPPMVCEDDRFEGNQVVGDWQRLSIGQTASELVLCPNTEDWYCIVNIPLDDYHVQVNTVLEPNAQEDTDLDVEVYSVGNPLSLTQTLGVDEGVGGTSTVAFTSDVSAFCFRVYGHNESSTNTYSLQVRRQADVPDPCEASCEAIEACTDQICGGQNPFNTNICVAACQIDPDEFADFFLNSSCDTTNTVQCGLPASPFQNQCSCDFSRDGGVCAQPNLVLERGDYAATTNGLDNNHQPSCAPGESSGPEAVWSLGVESAGPVCLSTEGSSFDTLLYVRAACDDTFAELACNNDAAGLGTQSRLTLDAMVGTTYFIYVDGQSPDDFGDYTLNVTDGPCPAN